MFKLTHGSIDRAWSVTIHGYPVRTKFSRWKEIRIIPKMSMFTHLQNVLEKRWHPLTRRKPTTPLHLYTNMVQSVSAPLNLTLKGKYYRLCLATVDDAPMILYILSENDLRNSK